MKSATLFGSFFRRFFLALSLTAAWGCGSKPVGSPDTPVILISIDTLRSDHLPVYGYTQVATPAIDAFRRDAVLFEHAFSPCPLTSPAHATMLTGLLPTSHGVRDNGGFALDEGHETLAERLQREGYQTGAVVSSMVLRRDVGLAQGFDFYDDRMRQEKDVKIYDLAQRRGDQSLKVARDWLDQKPPGPFFFFLHLYDPHIPYQPPEPFASQYDAPYDGEIAYTDSLLAEFFQALKRKGIYDDALIILTSDHGEGLGDHHEKEHGMFLYRELIQVPLLIKFPGGVRANTSVSKNVGLVDLFTTVTEVLGLPTSQTDGVSLQDPSPPADRPLYAESLLGEIHFGWYPQKSVVTGKHHYIKGYDQELYDLIADPGERHNLFGQVATPSVALALLEELGAGTETTRGISEEERELLASLGYTGSQNTLNDSRQVTPPEIIGIKETVTTCQYLINQGNYAAAEARLTPLLTAHPAMRDARISLGTALKHQNKHEAAAHVLAEGLLQSPDDRYLLTLLAESQYNLGKPQEARTLARKALAVDPGFAGRNLLMRVYREGDLPLAEDMARRMMEQVENDPRAHFVLGRIAGIRGKDQAAVHHLERAETLFGEQADSELQLSSSVFLAETYHRLGRAEAGIEALRRALSLNPGLAGTRVLLSEALARHNRLDEAEAVLFGSQNSVGDPGLLAAQLGLHLKRGRQEDAMALASRELAKDPGVAEAVGTAFLNHGQPALAERASKLLMVRAPQAPFSYFLLGRLAQARKQFSEALTAYQKCLDLLADANHPGLRHQTLFLMGDSAASLGRAGEALHYFQEAVRVMPEKPESQIALATLLARLGEAGRAVEVTDRWLARFPRPDYYRLAAEAMARMGLAEVASRYRRLAGQQP